MNGEIVKMAVALAFALVLSVFAGWLFGRRGSRVNAPLGLPEGSVRGILAVLIVGTVLLMVGIGLDVPEFLSASFGLVIGLYFGARTNATAESSPREPASQATRPVETQKSGRAALPVLLLCALCASAVPFLAGCVTSTGQAFGVVQDSVDDVADRVGIDGKYLDAGRSWIATREAIKTGQKIVPRDAIVLPASATPFAEELREIGTERIIEGGVYRRQVYEVKTILAAPTAAPVAPAPKLEPAPEPVEVPAPHSEISNLESEILHWSVQAMVTKAAGPIADTIATARVVAAVTVAGAPGWPVSGGDVTLAGNVQSLEGAPAGIDLKGLVFSNVPARVSGGILHAASAAGASVAFTATANLSNGAVTASAVPAVGSVGAAFLQSLEVAGAALVTGSEIVQSRLAALPATPAHAVTRLDAATLRKVFARGSNLGLDYSVPSSWPSKSSKGKTINAMLCINGRKVDWMKPGQTEKTMGNLYHDPDFFQGIRKGQTVDVSIKDLHGKRESNRLPFVWPWADTP